MKAMRLHQTGLVSEKPLTLDETARPKPAADQIRIKVHMCGVCHTDLHTVEGELTIPALPLIPGHQVVGTVESVGSAVTRHQAGDRVGVAWLNWACGACSFCRQGLENLCQKARFTGLDADGGYAEYLVVDERYAFPLPGAFTDAEAAPLLCAGIIGYRSLRLSEIKPGGRLGLYGFGASAHLAIQVARHWGCEVYVFTRSAAHQRHARELGAAWTGQAQDQPPVPLDAGITFAPGRLDHPPCSRPFTARRHPGHQCHSPQPHPGAALRSHLWRTDRPQRRQLYTPGRRRVPAHRRRNTH